MRYGMVWYIWYGMYHVFHMVYGTPFCLLCAGNVNLCNGGATQWLDGTTSLIELYHLLFSNITEDQDVFLFNSRKFTCLWKIQKAL